MANLPPLVLSTCTLLGVPFRYRVEAAAAAGFQGIGLNDRDYGRAHEQEGLTDAAMRELLHANGLQVMELEFVSGWSHGGDVLEAAKGRFNKLLEMSEIFEVGRINVGGDTAGSAKHVADSFGTLCDQAAPYNVTVALEPMPYTTIRDLHTANKIVQDAGRRNAGVLLDSWHLQRGGGLPEMAGLISELVVAVQINDAPRDPETDLEDEGEHRRLLPGEGAIDLVGFLNRLWTAGIDQPIGVEVISDRLQQMEPLAAAQAVGSASRDVLTAASKQKGDGR